MIRTDEGYSISDWGREVGSTSAPNATLTVKMGRKIKYKLHKWTKASQMPQTARKLKRAVELLKEGK